MEASLRNGVLPNSAEAQKSEKKITIKKARTLAFAWRTAPPKAREFIRQWRGAEKFSQALPWQNACDRLILLNGL
jgi:hypothetical protein